MLCQHSLWVLVCVLLMQMEKESESKNSVWASANHVGDLDDAPPLA